MAISMFMGIYEVEIGRTGRESSVIASRFRDMNGCCLSSDGAMSICLYGGYEFSDGWKVKCATYSVLVIAQLIRII